MVCSTAAEEVSAVIRTEVDALLAQGVFNPGEAPDVARSTGSRRRR